MASDIRFNIRLPVLLVGQQGLESLRSVYVFFRTLTPCVRSRIFLAELSGFIVNRVPCHSTSWPR